MSATLTTVADALRTLYLPTLRDNLNNEVSPVASQLENRNDQVEGEAIVHHIRKGRTSGTGARAEGDTLPTSNNQKYDKTSTGLYSLYGRVEFTGHLMRRAVTERGAVVNAVQKELDGMLTDITIDFSRQVYNDANDYVIRTTGTPTGQVVSTANATANEYRSLIEGMAVDIGSTGVQADGANSVTVSTWDEAAQTITFVGTITSVTGTMFVRKEDSFAKEITGLRSIVNSGDTLFGIDGSSVKVWNSYVDDNGGTLRTPTEALIGQAIDEIAIKSGKVPDLSVSSHSVCRNVAAQMESRKRFVNTIDLKGGHSGISVATGTGEIALMADRFCPENDIFMLNTEHLSFQYAGESDWNWVDFDGAVLRNVANKDAFEAYLVKDCDLVTDFRAAHGRIKDVQGLVV